MLNGEFGEYKVRGKEHQDIATIKQKPFKRFEKGVLNTKASASQVSNTHKDNGWARLKQEELGSDSDQGVDSPESDVRDRSVNHHSFQSKNLNASNKKLSDNSTTHFRPSEPSLATYANKATSSKRQDRSGSFVQQESQNKIPSAFDNQKKAATTVRTLNREVKTSHLGRSRQHSPMFNQSRHQSLGASD